MSRKKKLTSNLFVRMNPSDYKKLVNECNLQNFHSLAEFVRYTLMKAIK